MAASINYFKGFDSYVVYGAETSFGAGATPAVGNRVGKVTNVNVTMTNNFFKTQGLGEGRNVTGAYTGPFDVSGSIDWDVDDFTFMQYAIGAKSGAGTLADPWELKELDNIGYAGVTEIPTIALEIGSEGGSVDHEITVDGCVVNNLTLTASQGEVLKASCDFIGRNVTSSATIITYTTPTTSVFVFQQGSVNIGAETFDCTSFALTIANNMQTYRNLGSRLIQQPVTGLRKYDFTITFKFKGDTTASTLSGTELLAYFFGAALTPATAATVTSYPVSLDIAEGAAATDRVVAIDLENCYFESWSQPVPLEGGVLEVTVNGFGLAGLTDTAVHIPIRWYAIS